MDRWIIEKWFCESTTRKLEVMCRCVWLMKHINCPVATSTYYAYWHELGISHRNDDELSKMEAILMDSGAEIDNQGSDTGHYLALLGDE